MKLGYEISKKKIFFKHFWHVNLLQSFCTCTWKEKISLLLHLISIKTYQVISKTKLSSLSRPVYLFFTSKNYETINLCHDFLSNLQLCISLSTLKIGFNFSFLIQAPLILFYKFHTWLVLTHQVLTNYLYDLWHIFAVWILLRLSKNSKSDLNLYLKISNLPYPFEESYKILTPY